MSFVLLSRLLAEALLVDVVDGSFELKLFSELGEFHFVVLPEVLVGGRVLRLESDELALPEFANFEDVRDQSD